MEFGPDYEGVFARQAMAAIKLKSSDFETEKFFRNRSEIKEGLFKATQSRIDRKLKGAIHLRDFQLKGLKIPAKWEESITEKLISEQKIKTREVEKSISILIAKIQKVQNLTQAIINMVNKIGKAKGVLLKQKTAADAR